MKNILLLSSLCLINITQAKEIPSFNHLLNNTYCYYFCRNDEEATTYVFKYYLRDEIPLEDIEPAIISWFKEKPILYDYAKGNNVTQDDYYAQPPIALDFKSLYIIHQRLFQTKANIWKQLANYMQKPTYVDIFRVSLRQAIHCNHEVIAAKCRKVIGILKNLGIEQALSDNRIDLLAQLGTANSEIDTTSKPIRDILEKEITILEKLLATYE